MSWPPSLRRHGFLVAVLFAVSFALLQPVRFPVNVRLWDALMNATHAPLFAVLTWLLYRWGWPVRGTHPWQANSAALGAFTLAAVLELLQGSTGRTPSIADVAFSTGGILCTWCALHGRRLVALLLGIGVTIAVTLPVAREAGAVRWRSANHPLLADFEDRLELRLWAISDGAVCERITTHATRGEHSLRVTLPSGAFPGVRLLCGDRDWSAASLLAFDIHNEGEPFDLALRIDDRETSVGRDGFNGALRIERGENEIRIPLAKIRQASNGRQLSLEAIRQVIWFRDHPTAPCTFYLDKVRLE